MVLGSDGSAYVFRMTQYASCPVESRFVSPIHSLSHVEPFRRLSAVGRRILSHGVKTTRTARAAKVLQRGQTVSGAYVVVAGRLRVFTIAPNGTEATLYFIEPGEACVLAINCLFNDHRYPAWVQAERASTIAVIPGTAYRKLFETEVAIQNLTVQALSTLVYRLMAELEQVHSAGHRERLAHFILANASSNDSLETTQQQLAHHLGTTREVVARLMQELVAKRLVRTGRGMIQLLEPAGLREIAGNVPFATERRRARE
jgi:CRP/FNR family transcriptional regulator, anaerobic regulatory protein